jgi:hypothetical protein
MAEVLTPSGMVMGSGGGDGLFGSGGGGLIGGLILGSLLRQGNGGLFGGGDGSGGASAVTAQGTANMALMQAIGAVDKAVAVAQGATELSNAVQTGSITTSIFDSSQTTQMQVQSAKDASTANSVALMQQLNTVNTNAMANTAAIQQNVMENRYVLAQNIAADGDKTRALITQQYEINLQRQLADANAAIIELRSRENAASIGRGVEVTTTNNINQMQSQQQQQQQFGQLANLIFGLQQSIRSNNEAINVGSGTLTANPTNTNTNIR